MGEMEGKGEKAVRFFLLGGVLELVLRGVCEASQRGRIIFL